jgi:hypothetical protein
MGLNLAVFMADYYLFYYEFTFVKRLVDLIDTCSPQLLSWSLSVC